jgi:hypothetical protein
MFARLFRNPIQNDRVIDLGNENRVRAIKNYDIIKGIELIGSPIPVFYEELARCPRNITLPKLKKLLNPKFYQKRFYDKTVKLAAESLGEERGLVESVVSSQVNIADRKTNVFIFPAELVSYTQAVQFLRKSESGNLSIKGEEPNKYISGKFLYEKCQDKLEGLVGVEIFSQPVDFREYFETPEKLYEWHQNHESSLYVIQDVLDSLKKNVEDKAKEIEKTKKVNIKGILLSKIEPKTTFSDNIFTISTSPYGKFILGASYLI